MSHKGFTLIELLISVSIIVILSGAMIPSFSTYIRNQNIKQAVEQVKSDLRTLQNNALTDSVPEDVTLSSPMYWGVLFEKDSASYYYFNSTDTNDCVGKKVSNQKFTLPEHVVSLNTYCLFFKFSNGDVVGDNYVAITDTSSVSCVKVTPVGSVYKGIWNIGGSTCD